MEYLISIIVMLLIALYRISRGKCSDDPQGTADRAYRRGIEELDKYYHDRDK